MKLGIFSWFGYILPLEDRLKLIKNAGFDTVSLWWGEEFVELTGTLKEQVESSLACGLEVENGHLPYYEIDSLWTDSLESNDVFERLKKLIKLSGELGVRTLVIHPYHGAARFLKDGKFFLPRFKALVECAENSGVTLALENLSEFQIIRDVLSEISSDSLGFCFDSGHANVHLPRDFSLLSEFPTRLAALHLHDNGGYFDEHLLPLSGSVPWDDFTKALGKTSFQGSILLESISPNPGIDVKSYLSTAYNRAKEILNMVK
ncbi:sugar phosphate isomerase/epimerase family protein [Guggenheimella bovis]